MMAPLEVTFPEDRDFEQWACTDYILPILMANRKYAPLFRQMFPDSSPFHHLAQKFYRLHLDVKERVARLSNL